MSHDDLLTACYHRVHRQPLEATPSAAIGEHSAACGLIAYVVGLHPDYVARCVAERASDKPVNDKRDQALRDEGWEYNQARGGFQRVPKP